MVQQGRDILLDFSLSWVDWGLGEGPWVLLGSWKCQLISLEGTVLTAWDKSKERKSLSEKEVAWSETVPHSLIHATHIPEHLCASTLQELKGLDG